MNVTVDCTNFSVSVQSYAGIMQLVQSCAVQYYAASASCAGLITPLPASDSGSTAAWGRKRINPRSQFCLSLTWSEYPSNDDDDIAVKNSSGKFNQPKNRTITCCVREREKLLIASAGRLLLTFATSDLIFNFVKQHQQEDFPGFLRKLYHHF